MAKLVPKKANPDLEFLANTRRIALLSDERKAIDIRAYDVRNLTVIADSFVICSANSEPHLKAIVNAVKTGMKDIGVPTPRIEGAYTSGWVVLDFGNIIVHVFRDKTRAFYDLDGMWADAPRIDLDLETEMAGASSAKAKGSR